MHVWDKVVGILNKRKQTTRNDKHWFKRKKTMSQARVLTDKELNLLLLFIKTRKHSERNRAMLLMTHYAGMRVGEVAAVKVGDVIAVDGSVKPDMRLTAEQTKGRHARTVVLSDSIRKELLHYLQARFETKQLIAITTTAEMKKPLFNTQKANGFTANTLCYTFHMLYKSAGLIGASSHSGRRHFLTKLSKHGVALRTMMELAGHRQAQTTMRYIDVTDDMKRAAVELI